MASEGRFELDPKEIARAAFPAAFRGYDQDSVRHYLTRLAQAVARGQQRGVFGVVDGAIEEADARAAQFEQEAHSLRQQVAELESRLAASPAQVEVSPLPQPPKDLDESELIGLLGNETARVLETARAVAAENMAKAQSDAAEILAQAEAEVDARRKEAEMALTSARAESQQIREEASEDARRSAERMRADSDRIEAEAKAGVERIMADAAVAAEAELAKARQQANRLISDAETLREEILTDLLRRRRANQEQLNRLIEARSGLASALVAAQSQIDAVASDVHAALPDGAEIDLVDHMGEGQDGDLDDLRSKLNEFASISGQTAAATPYAATGPTESTPGAGQLGVGSGADIEPGSTSPHLSSEPSAVALQDSARVGFSWEPDTEDGHEAGVAGEHITGGLGHELDQGGRDVGLRAGSDLSADRDAARSEHKGTTTMDGLVFDGGGVAVDTAEGFDVSQLEPDVTSDVSAGAGADSYDLRGTDDPAPRVSAHGQWTANTSEVAIPADFYTNVFDRDIDLETTPLLGKDPASLQHRSARRGDLPREAPFTGHLPLGFESRDIALARSTPGFKRRLKRAVNDDQSHVLDRLRAGRGLVQGSELPPVSEQLEGYLNSLRPALVDVVKSGGDLLGSVDVPYHAVENLSLQLAKHMVDCVRRPTVDAIDQAATDDREAIMDPIRVIYRDFRNTVLPELIDDALHEAFSMGLFHGIGDGDEVLWMVDPRLDADPVCEENSAAPAMTKGAVFPSGHVRPLSMPGCRCLVLPAR